MHPDDRTRRGRSFESVAEIYERARPGYPADAVEWLVGDAQRVLDLAAGTGKLTRALAARGREVVAVEPSEAMLTELRRTVPAAEALAGSAEAIPLPDRSVDAVTVAQAFHWFDLERALEEIARVLRPSGVLGLVWNARDDREPWVARLSETIGTERLEGSDLEVELEAELRRSRSFTPLEHRTFEHAQRLDRATLLDLVASRSMCAVSEPLERARMLAEVGAVFDEFASDGEVTLPYLVDAYRAVRS